MYQTQNQRAPSGSVLLPGNQVLIAVPVPSQTTRAVNPVSLPTDPYPYNMMYYGGQILGTKGAEVTHLGP